MVVVMMSNGGGNMVPMHMHIKFLLSSIHRRDAEINELNNAVEDNNTLIAQLQKRIKELEVGYYHWLLELLLLHVGKCIPCIYYYEFPVIFCIKTMFVHPPG
jgi:hypothetical protein